MTTVIATTNLATAGYLGPPLTALTPVVVDETDPYIASLIAGAYLIVLVPPDPAAVAVSADWVANTVDYG